MIPLRVYDRPRSSESTEMMDNHCQGFWVIPIWLNKLSKHFWHHKWANDDYVHAKKTKCVLLSKQLLLKWYASCQVSAKNTCQLKTIKITTKTQLNDQLGSKKITTTFHSGDFCKPSSCYQQTEVIELLAEAITSAYFWCMRWLYGLHSSNSSMQNAALSYSCSCKYISHSSSHASESLMCLQQIQTEFPSFKTSDNSLPSHLTRRQWQACRSMLVPEHPRIHRWIDNPKT